MSPGRKEPVRVGVVGTGAISQIVYLPILAEREDVDLLALSDLERHKARTLAERFGARRELEDQALFEDPDVEAVFICTPNHLHEDQAVRALEAGKHVLVERPLAFTPEGVARVEAAARDSGRSLVAGMAHRFRPDVVALTSFVAGGELGRVYSVHGAWLNRRIPLPRTTWRQRKAEAGGGALVDLGVPALDLCLWLVGYPAVRRVRATLTHGEFEVEDAATLMAETEDGTAITVEVSWGYFAGDDLHAARLLGTEGAGSLPPLQIYKQLGGRPLEVTPRQPTPRGGENPYTNAYRREIDHFLRVVVGEVDAPFPSEQARLMALLAAAYRSAEEGREVEL